MLDVPSDVFLEPIAVELEQPVEEKWELKEESQEFDELFGKIEEISGTQSDEVQVDLDLEAADSETAESPEENGEEED